MAGPLEYVPGRSAQATAEGQHRGRLTAGCGPLARSHGTGRRQYAPGGASASRSEPVGVAVTQDEQILADLVVPSASDVGIGQPRSHQVEVLAAQSAKAPGGESIVHLTQPIDCPRAVAVRCRGREPGISR